MTFAKSFLISFCLRVLSMAAIPASATIAVTAVESTSIVTQVDNVDGTFEIRDPGSGDLVGYLLVYDRARQQVYGFPQ